jgi:2-succinyl-5-enolpyruvyl-6-hydroxy-3-cyclohexene-1-carboxylate synthase
VNLEWARLLLGSLAEAGAGELFVSPGSRSTPLVLAAAELGLVAHPIVDERAAAFAALGWSRAHGRPAVLVCTSGTAAAHYLPAVIEAAEAFVPLIALTADRPLELRGCAAPQTIDQVHLFGRFARAFVDLGAPVAEPAAVRALRRKAAQAVAAALGPSAGPVHLDAPFAKPLEPSREPDAATRRMAALCAEAAATPIVRARSPRRVAHEGELAELVAALELARRPLLAAGPLRAADAAAARTICAKLGAPLYAEATSQLAGRTPGLGPLLAGPRTRAALAPDRVIELGAPPVASSWSATAASARRTVLAPDGWMDPDSSAAALVRADLAELAAALPTVAPKDGWGRAIAGLAERAAGVARRLLEAPTSGAMGEPAALAAALAAVPTGARLLVSNSLPVRLVDLVPGLGGRDLEVVHQRGAAGIDGLIAGAAGAAQDGAPLVALLGDVAFAHDVGGLAVARTAAAPLVLVVLDNGGGRIFGELPVAGVAPAATIDRFFTTPPGLDPVAVGAAFGVRGVRVERAAALRDAIATALGRTGPTIVHAVVEPTSAGGFLAALGAEVDAACADLAAEAAR